MSIDPSKRIGYVLSGGGTKGLAHAGALHYLEEQGIHPSVISGTSAGSIVGSLYAWGKKPEEILDFFKSIYFFHWTHFTLKKPGLIDSNSFKKYFEALFGPATIQDSKIPLYITATDLVKGELKIFEPSIALADAVLASSAFPGVISPHIINGTMYSDGGILNHFPADIIADQCDFVIGIYVSPIEKIEAHQLRSIKAVTTRAFDLLYAHTHMQKFGNCDLVIEPEALCNYSTFETNKTKMDEIYQIGYEEAKKRFESL
ncbi:MAG: hypothetical protein RLZZ500_1329 [Bacteroidota bacterium]|jgi:NTE family protein